MIRNPIPIRSSATPITVGERGDALGEERGVQGRGERGLGHPDVAGAVLDGLAGLLVDRGGLLVVCRLAARSQVAAHLGVHLAGGGLEGVQAHAVGEQLGVSTGVDGLVCDLLVHVGRADDLLLLERVADLRTAVEPGVDRADAEAL